MDSRAEQKSVYPKYQDRASQTEKSSLGLSGVRESVAPIPFSILSLLWPIPLLLSRFPRVPGEQVDFPANQDGRRI